LRKNAIPPENIASPSSSNSVPSISQNNEEEEEVHMEAEAIVEGIFLFLSFFT
jgi:hypothetical protein